LSVTVIEAAMARRYDTCAPLADCIASVRFPGGSSICASICALPKSDQLVDRNRVAKVKWILPSRE
jgi:hypothetical protein